MVDDKTKLEYVASLHKAALKADLKGIRRLLTLGVDVNQRLGADGYALMNCIQFTTENLRRDWNSQELQQLKQHLRLGAQYRYATSQAAVDRTSMYTQFCINCTKELFNHGANTECCDSNGKTPLIAASYHYQYAILELLLEKGANINAQDKRGYTAMSYADDCSKCLLVHWSIKTRTMLSGSTFLPPQEISDYLEEYKEGFEYQRQEALFIGLSFFPYALQLLVKEYIPKV